MNNRPIKFRAWDKIKSKWIFDAVLENGGNIGQVFSHSSEGYGGLIAVKNYPGKENIDIQFFTGLLDKDGRMIWERDIVKHDPHWADDRITSVVKYFGIFPFHCGDWSIDNDECEVIGNIWENSELMEGETEALEKVMGR